MPNLTPTILLLNLPPAILCGIDLLAFTTAPRFQGIKDLPPGFHFLYTSETSSQSIRDGFWFYIPAPSKSTPSPLILRSWDPATSALVPSPESAYSHHRARLPELWAEHLTPYRQSAAQSSNDPEEERNGWASLIEHVTPRLLTRLTGGKRWQVTSASCGVQDRDDIPGLSAGEVAGTEQELGFLNIDLKKTWRDGAVGRERTEGAVDRSWAIENLVERGTVAEEKWGNAVLGEMEVCFLMVLTLSNFSCLEEWKRVLGLALTCRRAVAEREEWFADVLRLLRRQLGRGEDVEGGLFDMSDEGGAYLKGLLKGFKRTLGQVLGEDEGVEIKGEMKALEGFLRSEYGWELSDDFVRRGMLELEDGEQVEMEMDEMEAEDERGEYAPVIVDLG